MSGGRDRIGGADALPVLIFVIFAAALAWLFFSPRETPQNQSAAGFDGLARWLRAEDALAGVYHGNFQIDPAEIGLRVYPIYDTNLSEKLNEPRNDEEMIFAPDELDLISRQVAAKARRARTLLILPKWRRGMRLTRIAHPVLLNDTAAVNELVSQLKLPIGAVAQTPRYFEIFDFKADTGERLEVSIYAPRLAAAGECAPLIGDKTRMLLGRCPLKDADGEEQAFVFVLTDPDLLSNHGLALGDNARIAASLLPELAGEKRILIDYSLSDRLARRNLPERKRTWADLGRFFEYPFTLLWIGFGALTALALWRSWVRFGAPLPDATEAPEASKTAAIDAKARLLRLAGHDGALLAAHVEQRLSHALTEIFGPHAPAGKTPLAALRGFLERRGAPALAERLTEAASAARNAPPGAATGDAVRRLDEFELAIEEVLREFGRTSRRG